VPFLNPRTALMPKRPAGVGCSNYVTSTTTGNTIEPGSADTGNHCDDCSTAIALPFPVSVYGQTFNAANVASNGALDLIGNTALPSPMAV
jgi:hypothetical protein